MVSLTVTTYSPSCFSNFSIELRENIDRDRKAMEQAMAMLKRHWDHSRGARLELIGEVRIILKKLKSSTPLGQLI
jgi:hypothetical protein